MVKDLVFEEQKRSHCGWCSVNTGDMASERRAEARSTRSLDYGEQLALFSFPSEAFK